jgi:porin
MPWSYRTSTAGGPCALEAWLDWGFHAHGPGSVRVGLYDLNSEFDTAESRGLINSAYGIGQELAQTGHNGPSIYPVTALAARLAWTPAEPWLIEFAVVDGVPGDPDGTHRSRWHLSRSKGALRIGEVDAPRLLRSTRTFAALAAGVCARARGRGSSAC